MVRTPKKGLISSPSTFLKERNHPLFSRAAENDSPFFSALSPAPKVRPRELYLGTPLLEEHNQPLCLIDKTRSVGQTMSPSLALGGYTHPETGALKEETTRSQPHGF